MRKFLRVFIIIIIFFSCLALGIYLAEFSLPDDREPSPTRNADTNNQVRLLVFVVDQLDNSDPELLSTWSVVLYYPEPKGIFFVPISNPLMPNFELLKQDFDLTEERDPELRLVQTLEKQFHTHWDGSVVLDQTAVDYLSQWITHNQYIPDEQGVDLMNDPEAFFGSVDQICSQLQVYPANELDLLDWSSLIPQHFRTNLPFEKVMTTWQHLKGDSAPLCDLIRIDS